MTAFNTSSITVRAALAGLALFGAGQSMAQTINGTVDSRVGNGGYIANITFTTGSTIYGAAGVVACIEPGAEFPVLPSSHTYDVVGAASVIDASATYANKADALMNWVVDHYYAQTLSWNIDGQDFNQVLWEITQDFDGTASSMAFNTGEIQSTRTDYKNMLSAIQTAYSSISDTYRSTSFSVHYLVDHDTRYQNMLLITPAVPEPSTYLMMFAGVGALMAYRRRTAKR